MTDIRLIEKWLPIADLSEESVRERRFAMQGNALPPNNSLHVWWARRPLVASRAAILASALSADADHGKFLHMLGIHGHPAQTRKKILVAKKSGEDLGSDPYGYPRAYRYSPNDVDRAWLEAELGKGKAVVVLDPTAGGGSIPFEAARLGFTTFANDLNPVASLIQKATIEYPFQFGEALSLKYRELVKAFLKKCDGRFDTIFPPKVGAVQVQGYLWARTMRCPYCDGLVPLSPNWRLSSSGEGIKLKPILKDGPGSEGRICEFEIAESPRDHSAGTMSDGDATCPYPDCARVIDGEHVKATAQAEGLGEQLYAVAYKDKVSSGFTASGSAKFKTVKAYRPPLPEDSSDDNVAGLLEEKSPLWDAIGILPTESIGDISNYDRGHRMYGMHKWQDLFSARQFLVHMLGVEIFHELVETFLKDGGELEKACLVYLALSLDRFRDYNSRMTRWHVQRDVVVNTFDSHNYAMRWSYTNGLNY